MLKTILILALIVNTTYILPSHSSLSRGQDLAVSCAAETLGIICACVAYKGFKTMSQLLKEVDRQIEILKDMGVKVCRVAEWEIRWGDLVTIEYFTRETPSNFSQEQKKKANEHWNLLLANEKKSNSVMVAGLATVSLLGSLILIPAGIVGIIQGIKRFQ